MELGSGGVQMLLELEYRHAKVGTRWFSYTQQLFPTSASPEGDASCVYLRSVR